MARGPNPQRRFRNLGLGVVTAGFGVPTRQEVAHGGVDVAAPSGTPIHSPVNGVVTKVDEGHMQGENNFGNQVELTDLEGKRYQFNHLQNILMKSGRVKKGQVIATVGKTGAVYSPTNSDPSNLDFRIVDSYNRYVDPTRYISHL